MAIGLVTDDDFTRELEHHSGSHKSASVPSVPSVQIPVIDILPTKGRNQGDVNVPEGLRKIIGEDSVINGRQSALGIAKEFGISSASVSAYAKGATSTASYNTPSKEIISHINMSRRRAIKKSGRVLNAALAAITQEKLDYTDAKDLSSIAKDMATVIKNLEPPVQPTEQSGANAPQFVIYAPTFRDERSFDSIVVKE